MAGRVADPGEADDVVAAGEHDVRNMLAACCFEYVVGCGEVVVDLLGEGAFLGDSGEVDDRGGPGGGLFDGGQVTQVDWDGFGTGRGMRERVGRVAGGGTPWSARLVARWVPIVPAAPVMGRVMAGGGAWR